MPTSMPSHPGGDADSWCAAVLEPLLRGVAHALANRATAIDGLAAELGDGAAPAGELAAELHAEVARLLAVQRDLRAFLPDGAAEEPLDLRDAAREAASVAAYWPAGSLAPATIGGDAPAVRVARSVVVRVIVGMMVHAGLDGPALGLTLGGDDAIATVRVGRLEGEAPDAPDAPDAPAMPAASPWRAQVEDHARAMGGAVAWGRGGAELRLPTLRARRAAATAQAT